MNTFPLVRAKWSNEHIMAAVFVVSALYQLPQWVRTPLSVFGFLAVVTVSLILDAAVNITRYKRPTCAVSAAVTAAVFYALTPGIPLWGQLLGAAAALLVGKHLWGGTGKNRINPAITGVLLASLLFPVKFPPFPPSLLLIPAVLLSLPFIKFRPFAAVSFMVGMSASMLVNGELTLSNVLSYGVIFLGCLVLTDPVTTSLNPLIGAVTGLLGGFIPIYFDRSVFAAAIGVLAVNILSYAADGTSKRMQQPFGRPLKIRKAVPFIKENTVMYDLTGGQSSGTDGASGRTGDDTAVSEDRILERIRASEVFGLGGAAFPTFQKITAVKISKASRKHFIINGIECDPGLIHDRWLLQAYPGEIHRGIELLCRCIPFSSVTLAVKNAEDLDLPGNYKIVEVPDFYPAGAEKILIKQVLKKEILQDAVPAEAGILVLNVQTVYSLYEAVCNDRKADTRFITVADLKGGSGRVVRVKLGMKIREVLETIYPRPGYVFCGGGLMQAHIADEEDIIDKSVNFIAVGEYPRYKESPLCSKCGRCTQHCPAGLHVNRIAELVDGGKMGRTGRLHADRCIHCASCSYVCLAGRNLSAKVKTAKEYLREHQK